MIFGERNEVLLRLGDTDVAALEYRLHQSRRRADKAVDNVANCKTKYLQGNPTHRKCTHVEINTRIIIKIIKERLCLKYCNTVRCSVWVWNLVSHIKAEQTAGRYTSPKRRK